MGQSNGVSKYHQWLVPILWMLTAGILDHSYIRLGSSCYTYAIVHTVYIYQSCPVYKMHCCQCLPMWENVSYRMNHISWDPPISDAIEWLSSYQWEKKLYFGHEAQTLKWRVPQMVVRCGLTSSFKIEWEGDSQSTCAISKAFVMAKMDWGQKKSLMPSIKAPLTNL